MGTEVGVLFTQSPVGMALLDLEGRIRKANTALQAMLELPEAELEGRPLSRFLHPEDAAAFLQEFRQLAAGGTEVLEQDWRFHRSRSRQVGWLRFTSSLLRTASGTPRLAFAIVKDVTRWKQSESALRSAKQQAEEVSRTKSQFLAHMSHEIRTPIHTITGMSELLLDSRLDAEQREYTGQIRFASDVLLSLVNDVLDFSKIEAGRLSLEQVDFDLQTVVEEAVDLVSLEAHRKGLELAVFVAPRTQLLRRGDPARLRQVLVNLLSNAVKFTSSGEVELTVEPREGDELACAVRDSGIGISERQRSGLFRPFTQADASTTRKYGGTGLGLTIARNLVELMNGRIGVDSAPGRGSTFWFTCRLQAVPGQAPAEWQAALPGLPEQAPVLVVEDSAAARRAARGYLEGWGCRVEEAAEGQRALAALRTASESGRPVRVVLIDQRLPGMDGWQLAGEIKRDPVLDAARLILVSPAGLGAVEAKMRLLGWFAAYLTKPLKPRELATALVRCFRAGLELVEELEALPEEELPAGAAARVLVAEDHPVNRDMFRILLERCGCEVVLAKDGVEALRAAGAGGIDLIFLDLQMPNLEGQEAARRLRGQGVRAPIIGMSASVLSQEREQSLAAGMDGFLAKPFLMKDVQEVLRRFLPHRGAAPGEAPAGDMEPAVGGTLAAGLVPAAPDRVFDAARALAACLGDRATLARLAGAFLRRLEEQLAAIRTALGSGEAAEVKAEAHAVKGAALNLWAGELAERAGALEALAAAGRLAEAAAAFGALEAESRRFRELVKGSLPEAG